MKSKNADVQNLYFTVQHPSSKTKQRSSPSPITPNKKSFLNKDSSKALPKQHFLAKEAIQRAKVIIKLKKSGQSYPAYSCYRDSLKST